MTSRSTGCGLRIRTDSVGLADSPAGTRFASRVSERPVQRSASIPAAVCDHDAVGGRADDSVLLANRAGRDRGAAQRQPLAERCVEQRARRQQPRVAILLEDSLAEAGDDRALRDDAARHPFEPQLRLAGRQADVPGFADQGIAAEPAEVERREPHGPDRDRPSPPPARAPAT